MAEAAKAMDERRKALGKAIKRARLAKKWKQKQLAAAVSVEPITVSRWERGQHAPDWDMLALIAEVTERPLSSFVPDVEIGAGTAATDGIAPGDAWHQLSRQLQELGDDLLAKIAGERQALDETVLQLRHEADRLGRREAEGR